MTQNENPDSSYIQEELFDLGWAIIDKLVHDLPISVRPNSHSMETQPHSEHTGKLLHSSNSILNNIENTWSALASGFNSFSTSVQHDVAIAVQNMASEIQSKVYSPWISNAMDNVGTILGQLKNKTDRNHLNFPAMVILLQKLQKNYFERQRKQNLHNLEYKTQISHLLETDHVKRYGEIALNMQPIVSSSNQTIAAILSIKERDILHTWFVDDDSGIHCPKFIVFNDHSRKSIVLAIRGTYSIRDIVMDIVSDSVPYLEGWAHKGILEGAKKILQESSNILKKALEENPQYSLVITGHSLGGGAAQLIALEVIYGNWRRTMGLKQTRAIDVKCYAFGAPPIFVSNGNHVPLEVPQIKSFVNKADVIPTLSLATVGKTLAQISALESLELTFMEKSQMLLSEIISTNDDTTLNGIGNRISSQFEKILDEKSDIKSSLFTIFQTILEQFRLSSAKEANNRQHLKSSSTIKSVMPKKSSITTHSIYENDRKSFRKDPYREEKNH